MANKPAIYHFLSVTGELFIYLGLTLISLVIPALAFILWMMSLLGMADPDYDYLLMGWVVSLLVFILGVMFRKVSYNKTHR